MFAAMSAFIDGPAVLGAKLIVVYPGNPRLGRSSHLGVVVLFDPEGGAPMALADAAEVTAIRTAAASAVATRVLARPDAGDLAILGTGEQAPLCAKRTMRWL